MMRREKKIFREFIRYAGKQESYEIVKKEEWDIWNGNKAKLEFKKNWLHIEFWCEIRYVKNFKISFSPPHNLILVLTAVKIIRGSNFTRSSLNYPSMSNYRQLMILPIDSTNQTALNIGCLDWFFALLPNVIFLAIPSQIINVFDPATVVRIFKNTRHLIIINQITETELDKLQSLHFPNIFAISVAAEHPDRMKKFVEINSSLQFLDLGDIGTFKVTDDKQLVREENDL